MYVVTGKGGHVRSYWQEWTCTELLEGMDMYVVTGKGAHVRSYWQLGHVRS